MPTKLLLKAVGASLALFTIAAACGDDSGKSASTAATGGNVTTATAAKPDAIPAGLWNNGPCDKTLKPYPIGLITTFESPIVSLINQYQSAQASVEAFNARGGIGKHCMKLTGCDAKGDTNKEVDCARQIVNDGIVATVNDNTTINPGGVIPILHAAGVPRVGISPNTPDLNGKVNITYAFSGGGLGSVFAMPPSCGRAGHKKVGLIAIDSPQVDSLITPLNGILKAYGSELVNTSRIPAGTTDYTQFVLSMDAKGATCVMLPVGENEAVQVLRAAQQLKTKIVFAVSGASTGLAPIQALGDFASQILFNGDLPPAAASQQRWPGLQSLVQDLEVSGVPALKKENLKTSSMRSWVAVYALVRIVEDFGHPDDVSRAAITAAMNAAKDVNMLGLTPPWTPNASPAGAASPFGRISNPWYFVWSYDPATKNWKVNDDQVNILAELGGKIDYPQPAR